MSREGGKDLFPFFSSFPFVRRSSGREATPTAEPRSALEKPRDSAMAKATVDLLGELYGWDTKIDDVFALDAADPERDEDDALDAYEEVIGVATQPQQDGADAVLSLAAQLLAKHFYKFPHVHLNVVDVMLALCSVERQHAVRINTIRSLLQIVKTPASEAKPMARECLDRVREVLAKLVAKETSGVIMRHMTQLTAALKEREDAAAAKKEDDSIAKKPKTRAEDSDVTATAGEKEVPKQKPSKDYAERQSRGDPTDEYASKAKYDDRHSKDDFRKDDGERRQRKYERSDDASARVSDAPARGPLHGGFQGHGCPPGPYLFIGNVPFDIRNSDISDFLSEVDPTMKSNNVQIKYPPRGGSGYAFVSLPSTELAREAMRFVNKVKFQGRYLNSNFARGPPCDTLAFVERRKGGSMEDDDAVREFNFAKCHTSIWERLCEMLRAYGDFDVVEVGKIRFRDVESAKDVIKKHHYIVQGYEIIPIYEPEEQLRNDNTRSRYVPNANTTRHGFALKSGRVGTELQHVARLDEMMLTDSDIRCAVGDVGGKHSDDRGRNGDRKSDKYESRHHPPRDDDQGKNQRKRSDSPKKRAKRQDAPPSEKPKQTRDRSLSRSQSPMVAPSRKHATSSNRARSKSRSPSPAPVRKEDTRESRPKKSRSPARASRKHDVETRGRSKSRSSSPRPVSSSKKKEYQSRPRSPKKQDTRSASRSPARASHGSQKVPSQSKQQADRFRSKSPVNGRQATPFENRAGDRGDRGPKSRSRSGERSHFNGRDIRGASSFGPGRRGDDGGNGDRFERDQAPRTHDQGSEHFRPERRESGAWPSSGGMARYGPAGKVDSRDDMRNDRAIGNREYRESPQLQRPVFNNNPHDRNDQQRRRSRSPPRHRDAEVARSQSPQSRRPVDGPPRRASGGDNGFRGGRDTRMPERNGGSTGSVSRRDDDRSIAEIAREALEKQRQMQQMRREQQSSGGYHRHGDGGRMGEHYATPPSHDFRAPSGNGGFQRNRSRSPVRTAQPPSHMGRRNDLPRDRPSPPPRQMQPREFNRGNGARVSPQFDRPPERRDSFDINRTERRGRSPPLSPFMKPGSRRAPSPPVMERSRGHSSHGREDDRDRKRDHYSRRDGHDRSQKEQNRNVANSQRSNERSNRDRAAAVLDSPPASKRLRSLTPSPMRRDTNSYRKHEERTRSPILKRSLDRDAGNGPEKKRRVVQEDDDLTVPPKMTNSVFDDMDETMVDYDEDDD